MNRSSWVPIVLFAAVATAALVFRSELISWFSGRERATTTTPAAPTAPLPPSTKPAALTLPPVELSPGALTSLGRALDAYESIRAALAADRLAGIATYARDLSTALRASSTGLRLEVSDALERAAKASDKLAATSTLDDARLELGNVSEVVVALVASNKELQRSWHRFSCPMAKGFGEWVQRSPDISNPYMGTKMLTCGSSEQWTPAPTVDTPLSHAGHGHEAGDTAYYTCSMHPSVRQGAPGKCPICGMDLVPVTFDQQETGTIMVDEARKSVLGIQTSKAENRSMDVSIRAVGKLAYDETRMHDVTLKVKGYVARLDVNATGQAVARGQRLMTLYSPELFAAQQEYLLARTGATEHAALAVAAERKLRLLGVTDRQLEEIRSRGTPIEEIPILSPASGYVIEKEVVAGASIEAGQRLYRIAALDRIWVEAAIYESDLPLMKKGMSAKVSLPYATEREIEGKVAVVYPYLDPMTRTGKVRIELPNKELALKPDMFADVTFNVPLGNRLAVPVSAVVYTGPRRIVFLDLGKGQYRPQVVTLGARAGDFVEVTKGLTEGQAVVTEGNFLIAAESRIRSTTYWEDERGSN